MSLPVHISYSNEARLSLEEKKATCVNVQLFICKELLHITSPRDSQYLWSMAALCKWSQCACDNSKFTFLKGFLKKACETQYGSLKKSKNWTIMHYSCATLGHIAKYPKLQNKYSCPAMLLHHCSQQTRWGTSLHVHLRCMKNKGFVSVICTHELRLSKQCVSYCGWEKLCLSDHCSTQQ